MASNSATGITIIIPNFNGAHFLKSCLDSLLKSISLCPRVNFEIILVDNASTDNSLDTFSNFFIKNCFKISNYNFQIIRLKRNTGFAYAVNRGIEAANYDYVCVCNNDLTVDKNWFPQILSAIQSSRVPENQSTSAPITTFFGLVLNKDGTKVESRGLKFYPYGKAENIDNGLSFSQFKNSKFKIKNCLIWGASASIVVYHKPTLLKVGLFDERFFAYEEDVDLAFRLNKSGHKTLFIPQAISCHLGGGTSSRMGNFRQQHDFKNWILLITKNYSVKEILANSPAILIERLRNLSGVIKSTKPLALPQTLLSVFFKTFTSLFSPPYKNN